MMRLQHLLMTLAALFLPVIALAEEAAGTCEPNEFCFQIQGYYILDFIAFVAIFIYAGRKPLAAFLDKRYADVSKEIAAAHELRDAAQLKYNEYKARMDNLAVEMDKILSDARAGTQAETQRILADAQQQVERITAEEKLRLDQESKRIRDELQREASALALRLAEQMVREQLDAGAQQQLVQRALTEIEQLPATGANA